MGEDSIKVVSFWSSPYALRVQLGLQLKGLNYEVQEEDLFNCKSELLLKSNPVYKRVPVLIHNGKPVLESRIILEYIDEVWPQSPALLPRNAFDRAEVRFWADYVDTKFLSPTAATYKVLTSGGDERQKAMDELRQDWTRLDEYLTKKNTEESGHVFFGGSEMNLVDVMMSFVPWHWIPAFAVTFAFPDRGICPRLHQWAEAIQSCPLAKSVYPDKERLTAYVKERVEVIASAKS